MEMEKKARNELAERLSFENWIEYNLSLVQFIARKPRSSVEIHKAKRFGRKLTLTKKMNRGVYFGVLKSTSRFRGKYSLTARAEAYLEENHPNDERQGDHKEAA